MQIGAQLYTVHNHTTNLEDFSKTLKKVADIGYKSVQVSGTCPYEPEWLRDELLKNNLKCVLTHIPPKSLINGDIEQIVKKHAIFDCRNIGIGGMPATDGEQGFEDRYEPFREKFVPIAKQIRDLGAKLHFHNHYQEFQGAFAKTSVIDRILEDFPEDSIDFTLDLGWAAWAGVDVVTLIKKLSGRLSRIHLKDYLDEIPAGIEEERVYLRPIYEGKLDYDSYINVLSEAGCEYMLVEQDRCYNENEFDCLKRSFENVTKHFPDTK
ncbi:MAG: sugar phosphate isomerase/epimerase [Oscillospiraceae bacterium]|nr:sugar phosphate isomerase/epimerase [Oscillospiraceae bacterium]MBQ6697924.1 sugar phosphate isomerase/epimerase [Oscillospiraceae bacterium]